MNARDLLLILLVGALAAGFAHLPAPVRAGDPCRSIRDRLEQDQHRLTEYLLALQVSYDRHDFHLSEALNQKIVNLRREVDRLKERVSACSRMGKAQTSEGLSSAKTEEAQFATKSCSELRKCLLPLLRKIRALKRREKSVLSNLTPEEEAELTEASEQLKEVNSALKARCAMSAGRTSLMKRLRKW
jgi:hypothetical protein